MDADTYIRPVLPGSPAVIHPVRPDLSVMATNGCLCGAAGRLCELLGCEGNQGCRLFERTITQFNLIVINAKLKAARRPARCFYCNLFPEPF